MNDYKHEISMKGKLILKDWLASLRMATLVIAPTFVYVLIEGIQNVDYGNQLVNTCMAALGAVILDLIRRKYSTQVYVEKN